MKKQKLTKPAYKFEFTDTGKKDGRGEKIYHLYINGKTDSTAYTTYNNDLIGMGHEGSFAKMMCDIPVEYYPDIFYTTVEFKLPEIKKYWRHGNYVNIQIIGNTFTAGIYLSTPDMEHNKIIYLSADSNAEAVKNEIRKNKKSRVKAEEEVNSDISVFITGKPGETIKDLVKLLLPALENAFEKVRNNLLSEIKKLEKDVKSGAIEWI